MTRLLIALIFGVILVRCDSGKIYADFVEVNGLWEQSDTAFFKFKIDEPSLKYNIATEFRNSYDYPYHNLYFNYEILSEEGDIIANKLEEINLYEPKSGRPLGKGLGDVFDHEFIILNDFQFEKAGQYTLSLTQFMRVDTLKAIERVGIRIVKSEQ